MIKFVVNLINKIKEHYKEKPMHYRFTCNHCNGAILASYKPTDIKMEKYAKNPGAGFVLGRICNDCKNKIHDPVEYARIQVLEKLFNESGLDKQE